MHNKPSHLSCGFPVVELAVTGYITGVCFYIRTLISQGLEFGGIFFPPSTHIALNSA